jgi:hypothetical protein
MQRVTDLADPRRCKGASLDGQCQNVAEEGSDYCRVHGGESQAPARRLKQYLLTRVQDHSRLAQLDDPEGLKSLRDEVVIATGMLERRLNLASTDAEFISMFPQIERFLHRISDLKKSNLFLEQKSGSMLSRAAAFRLMQEIMKIIAEELDGIEGYEEIMDRIIDRIGPTIRHASNSDAEAE